MRRYWTLFAIILLAFTLRLLGLTYKSLWIDEADSVYFAQHLWPALLFRLCDPHPPGYYALLKVFIDLAGNSELVVRLPSALAGGLSVAALARLCHELAEWLPARWYSRRQFWLPAALLAVSPLHLWYSQEARMYALVAWLGLGAAIFTVRLMRRWQWTAALGYLATASLALFADQTALPILLGLNGLWLVTWRQRRPSTLGYWLTLQALIALLIWLWLRRAFYFTQLSTETFYPLTMLQLTLAGWAEALGSAVWVLLGSGVLLLTGGSLALWAKYPHGLRNLLQLARSEQSWAWLIVSVYLAGAVLAVVPRLYTLKRLLLPLLPYALFFVAWAVERLAARQRLQWGLLSFALALSLINIWLVPKAPWREAVAVIEAQIGPADVIWVDELAVPAFDYYAQGRHDRRILRVADLEAVGSSLAQSETLWLIIQTGRHRNLLEYLPQLEATPAGFKAVWSGIEARAYPAAQTPVEIFIPATDIPTWILEWPSPLDEACAEP